MALTVHPNDRFERTRKPLFEVQEDARKILALSGKSAKKA